MAWSAKQRGSKYYYRSIREGDRVRKVYYGRGEKAQQASQTDEERRRQTIDNRTAFMNELCRAAEADEALGEFGDWVDLLVQAALVANGMHIHRGQWRWRRYVRDGHG